MSRCANRSLTSPDGRCRRDALPGSDYCFQHDLTQLTTAELEALGTPPVHWLTAKEAGALLRRSERSVRALARAGKIAHYRTEAGGLLFSSVDLGLHQDRWRHSPEGSGRCRTCDKQAGTSPPPLPSIHANRLTLMRDQYIQRAIAEAIREYERDHPNPTGLR